MTATYTENETGTRYRINRTDGDAISGEVLELTRDQGWVHYTTWSGPRAMTVEAPTRIAADAAARLAASWKTEAITGHRTDGGGP